MPTVSEPGTIQFFDGYVPSLPADTYHVEVKHVVSGDGSTPTYDIQQEFVVQAPEFVIDRGVVRTVHPPAGSCGVYGQTLPFVVLTDPCLPWERSLVPGDAAGDTPWMALLVFAEGEIRLQEGTNNPVSTCTVGELTAEDPDVLKPAFPQGWLSDTTLASQCQTITVTGDAFTAAAPQTGDLPYLAHCRAVPSAAEGEVMSSVLVANRLAVADTRQGAPAPLRHHAHLVSLEGYAAYLGPGGTPVPQRQDGSGPKDVRLVSLTGWTFVSQPQTGESFTQLTRGLIDSQAATPSLSLPAPFVLGVDPVVYERLGLGYAPLTFVAGTGETSYAWYRGPFTPFVTQELPPVGDPAVEPRDATSADALMIYLADEGLFDLSYAAAWNIGRQLALADSAFAQTVNGYRRAAHAALGRLSQRLTFGHFSRYDDLTPLAAPKATRPRFSSLIGDGLGRTWTRVLESVHDGDRPSGPVRRRPVPAGRRRALHPRDVLALPGAADAVTDNLHEVLESIAKWLAELSLLRPVPFSHLVPDPRMLPAESVRFFYVDQGWIDTAVAGALSLAVHGSADVALLSSSWPYLRQAVARHRVRLSGGAVQAEGDGPGVTGMLIRSQLVAGWPSLVVSPSMGGAPLPVIRDDCLSPAVRLSLFQGVPDVVRLSEPYKGLRFGAEDEEIYPRCLTLPAATGAQITNAAPVPLAPVLRAPADGAVGGVIQTADLAARLETAAGVLPFAADAVVQWNGAPLATTVSGGQLRATVDATLVATAGTAAVTATTGGATSAPVTFTIDAALAVDELEPALTGAGSGPLKLTVLGRGFGADAVVRWNGDALTTQVVSVMEVTAAVPAPDLASPGTATVTVTSGDATSNPATFTVAGTGPAIDGLEPSLRPAGSSGFTLTVQGSGFTSGTTVQWNGSPLVTRIVADGTLLAAAVPKDLVATEGIASVTAGADGQPSPPAVFTVTGPDPTLGLLSPAVALAGGAGLTLTVDGVNFGTDAAVHWDGTALVTTWHDGEQVTATVPADLLTAGGQPAVTVVSGGVASNALPFGVITPQPVIGLLEPATVVAGTAGFTLTVTTGFGSGAYGLQVVQAPKSQDFPTPRNS
ncbi:MULTISPECIES: IPT/TIG domain-containing protein [unclassified Nonomuraea]|uniref:IPT/TIG domain-containing protein n=1 Tax=unclassified Nonomuraea TaxID=2593643 RepID=UPI0033E9C272